MPKLRRQSGNDLIRRLEQAGFVIVRIKGSHHILRRIVDGQTQTINIPVHGNQILKPGMLKRLYCDLNEYLSEDDLQDWFYTD